MTDCDFMNNLTVIQVHSTSSKEYKYKISTPAKCLHYSVMKNMGSKMCLVTSGHAHFSEALFAKLLHTSLPQVGK